MNEFQARWYVADRALDWGRGGVSHLSRLTGLSRTTITKACAELQRNGRLVAPGLGRSRQLGGGRKKVEVADARLVRQLRRIVEETTAGDPMSLLCWTSKSTRVIAEELTRLGHPITWVTVARCLTEMGYSLQANRKTKECPQHPNRDAQFRYINRQVSTGIHAGDPVISVDTNYDPARIMDTVFGAACSPPSVDRRATAHLIRHLYT
jgi:hypothetical protein